MSAPVAAVDVDVIIAAGPGRVLGRRRDGEVVLPRLRLTASWPPPSSQLPGAVAAETGLRVALLEPLDTTLFVAEPVDGEPAAGYGWHDAAAFGAASVRRWRERSAPGGRPAWYRPGWFAAATGWLDAVLAGRGARRTGPVSQIRHWTTSTVLRAPTTEGAVFLKAALPHLVAEPRVIAELARTWPRAVPEVLAHSAEHGWWLSADFGVQPPARDGAAALRLLARVQAATAGRTGPLEAAGCPVLTLDDLADRVPALTRRAEVWDRAGTGPGGLTGVAMWLQDRCAELADLDLPATLTHGDLHPDNAADRPDGPLLFDWSFARVSHPLFDLAGWLHQVPEPEARRQVGAYLDGWRELASPSELREAWRVAKPVAALVELAKFVDLMDRTGPGYEFDYLPMAAVWARRVLDGVAGRDAHLTGWCDPRPARLG
ncbi:aminoglycoside phosphotransferase family protein [Micromonospora sp. C28SCA-DRY-2]|uniref:aminoglycoside phosphotransferase family protein n=1 Tax=Micromonospora sp. C28SCA-DRY-2 TaxID=3059522 RepID=UPI00267584BC|nr:aminoglycoside phosphotransferase family protein [Micromonospora sp. C28SCA-DRY-2]MDO3705755.1 aminoglycoside phosphotransferase family protein [Micromonospora sp. C28SCA-DRY-2]